MGAGGEEAGGAGLETGLELGGGRRWWELCLAGVAWLALGAGLGVACQVAGWLLP